MRKPKRNRQQPERDLMEKQREVYDLLPATITRIGVQKKNQSRYSLYAGEKFIAGVSDHTLTRLNLRTGTEITHRLFDEIQSSEERWAVREYFVRLLARRDHSTLELRQKAQKKGLETSNLDEILQELQDKGYINHHTFAARFARDKFELNNWGSYKIRNALMQKGISATIIDHVLDNFDEQQLAGKMDQLVIKHTPRFKRAEPEKRKKKIFDFLLRKGYDSNNILKNMDRLLRMVEE